MSETGVARGECLCGAVRFELDLPVKFNAHCHCSMCRRAHGAALVTWVGVKTEQFRVTAGDDRLKRYQSSDESSRSFCGECGSSLLFESERWAGEVHVVLANLVDPVDKQPQAHVFIDDRVDWLELGDDLPRLGGPSGTEPK